MIDLIDIEVDKETIIILMNKKDSDLAKLKQAQQIMHEGLCYVAGGY